MYVRSLFRTPSSLILVALGFLTAWIAPQAMQAAKGSGSTVGSSNRYQVVQISEFRRDQYLIDTHTGKLWARGCISKKDSECSVAVWSSEVIEDITHSSSSINDLIKSVSGE